MTIYTETTIDRVNRGSINPKIRSSDDATRWKIITPPAIEPVTVAELKTFARIDTSDEDTLLTSYIKAARELTEDYLGRSLISRTIVLSLDIWLGEVIELPFPPLVDVSEVRTLNEDDTPTIYATTNYYVRTDVEPGQIIIRDGNTIPINTDRDWGGFEIEYIAGYGTQTSDVPEAIRMGIMHWAAWMYETRTPGESIPPSAEPWLSKKRILNV